MRPQSHTRPTFKGLALCLTLVGALGLVHLSALDSTGSTGTAPKQLENAAGGDCAACHEAAPVLPKDHPATKGQEMDACLKCHDGKKASNLVGKLPLSHFHHLQGVSCSDCHADGTRELVPTAKCLECHESGEALAKLTEPENKAHDNPHNSPHYGTELDCEMCHHAHKKSENYCGQCHDWVKVVP